MPDPTQKATRSPDPSAAAKSSMRLALGQQRWPMVDGSAPLLLVPVGSLEQHGPHLPLDTDTMVAVAVTRAVATRLEAMGRLVAVAPPVNYGASGEHEGFPGTVSIGHEALTLLLTELGRSACGWASGVIFVNGHGGNAPTMVRAVSRLRAEGRAVAWTGCVAKGGDAHAGATETSLLRHLAPWSVRVDLAVTGAMAPIESLLPQLRDEGVRAVSASGVLGDATRSSTDQGKAIFEEMVRTLVGELAEIDVGDDGRLRPGSSHARQVPRRPAAAGA
ncbi:MAG: mycofactocin biosynthesis peptidyl-dipeptidase MftE [Marmoricola sp.]